MKRNGVFSKTELESFSEIYYDNYSKYINIEALTMIDMASKQIIPAVMKYAGRLAKDVNEVKAAGADASAMADELKEITTELTKMKKALEDARNKKEAVEKHFLRIAAVALHNNIKECPVTFFII